MFKIAELCIRPPICNYVIVALLMYQTKENVGAHSSHSRVSTNRQKRKENQISNIRKAFGKVDLVLGKGRQMSRAQRFDWQQSKETKCDWTKSAGREIPRGRPQWTCTYKCAHSHSSHVICVGQQRPHNGTVGHRNAARFCPTAKQSAN
jgi:hypothetical protein